MPSRPTRSLRSTPTSRDVAAAASRRAPGCRQQDAVALTEVASSRGDDLPLSGTGQQDEPGETLAVAMLQGALERFGRDVLIAALACITMTRKGNVA